MDYSGKNWELYYIYFVKEHVQYLWKLKMSYYLRNALNLEKTSKKNKQKTKQKTMLLQIVLTIWAVKWCQCCTWGCSVKCAEFG